MLRAIADQLPLSENYQGPGVRPLHCRQIPEEEIPEGNLPNHREIRQPTHGRKS